MCGEQALRTFGTRGVQTTSIRASAEKDNKVLGRGSALFGSDSGAGLQALLRRPGRAHLLRDLQWQHGERFSVQLVGGLRLL